MQTRTVEPRSIDGLNEIIAFVQDPDGYQIELIEILANLI
ncbi:Lactoylglutathione lyase [hydrothermal vent metagenome]|uniref:Lactoylglutathione lyase n=1 Tax=hydrothermal vent metagenome TaxID=652676 RepID=A0A3B1AF30_9ZZZZ